MVAQSSRRAGVLVMAKHLARDRGDTGAGAHRCPRTRSLAIKVSESTAISCPPSAGRPDAVRVRPSAA
ncbi:hypothetical protein G6F31_016593 [Rhizopus arrhizus]|nr:hypothetical protein G6F31_016593 [Rhizopus arrhizus]